MQIGLCPRTGSNLTFRIGKGQTIHFLSLVIELVPSGVVITYFLALHFGYITENRTPWGSFIDECNVYADIPRWISGSTYLLAARKYAPFSP